MRSQIILQIAVVAVAIVLYDAFRAETIPRPPTRPEGARHDCGADSLSRRQDGLDHRLAVLERAWAALTETSPTDQERAHAPVLCPSDSWRPGRVSEAGEVSFDPREIAWFAALKAEVERRERRERAEQLIRAELSRIDVDLSEEQRVNVVALTKTHRRDLGSVLLRSASTPDARARRRAQIAELTGVYESSLRGLLPAAKAEVVLQRLGNYPGTVSR